MKTTILTLSLLVCVPLLAQSYQIDFETAPLDATSPKIGPVQFTGGIVSEKLRGASNQTRLYFSASADYGCPAGTCQPLITLFFDDYVSDVSLDLGNGYNLANGTFTFQTDNAGDTGSLIIAPLTATHVALPFKNIKRLYIHAPVYPDHNFAFDFHIDNVAFTVTPVRWRVQAQDLTVMPPIPAPEYMLNRGTPTATIPLGVEFTLGLQHQDTSGVWSTVPTTVSINQERVSTSNPLKGALYPSHLLVPFAYTATTQVHHFMVIHSGTAHVTLQPSGGPPVDVTVNEVTPFSLGAMTDPNNSITYDSDFIKVADRTGFPPQYVKAWSQQETQDSAGPGFNPFTWHYDPISKDYKVAEQQSFAFNPPWNLYALPQALDLCPYTCAFADLGALDILKRSDPTTTRFPLYYINDNCQRVLIPSNINPTIRDIYDANISQHTKDLGWLPDPAPNKALLGCVTLVPTGTQNPPLRHRAVQSVPDPLGVTAQTPLASSYGLLQVEHLDVIDRPTRWAGYQGHRNPGLLFDTPANAGRDTASLTLGSTEGLSYFATTNPQVDIQNPDFEYASRTDFEDALTSMWLRYNGGADYATNVLNRVFRFLPNRTTSIFSLPTCDSIQITEQTTRAEGAAGATLQLGIATNNPDAISSYQWYAGARGDTSSPLDGGTTPYYLTTVTSAANYWVRVTTECTTVDSATIPVTLTNACATPTLTIQPGTPTTIPDGGTVNLQATTNIPTTYQWFLGTLPGAVTPPGFIGDSIAITDATASTLAVAPESNTSYVVRASTGCTAATSTAQVLIQPRCPTIIAEPQSADASAGAIMLSVRADGTTPLRYQWYIGNRSDTSAPVPGATSPSLTVAPSTSTAYWARVANTCGALDSTAALVAVTQCVPPTITVQPNSATVNTGTSLTLHASANGTAPSYQWFLGSTGDTSTPVNGATSSSLHVTPLATTSYWVRVTNGCGTAASNAATITVTTGPSCTAPTITESPASTSITLGDSTTLALADAGTDPQIVQWYIGISGDRTQPVAGGTSTALVVTPTANTTYWAEVTNACGNAQTSEATVAVLPTCASAQITSDPAPATITAGASVTLTVATDGTQPLAYQWFIGQSGDESDPVTGATSAALTTTPLASSSYWVAVSNTCGVAFSAAATVTVNPACIGPQITAQPQPASITTGMTTTLTATASGTEPLAYAWFAGAPGETSSPVGTGATLSIGPMTTTTYWARVTNACGSADTASASVTVTPSCDSPVVAISPEASTIAAGASVTLTADTSGTSPFMYAWYVGSPSDTSQPTGNSQTLTVSPAATGSYWVRVTNACGAADSAATNITVTPACDPLVITTQPLSRTIVTGGTATLSVVATGTAPITYQWFASGVPIQDATTFTITVTPDVTTDYFVRLANPCGSVDSDVATVTLRDPCGDCGPGGGPPPQLASPALPAPADMTAIVRGPNVSLGWAAVLTADTYQVWRSTGGDFVPVATTHGSSYVDRHVPKGALRYFAVAMRSTDGATSAASHVASVIAH